LKTNSTVASLAILKVNWDTLGKDYVENFVPLVAECLREATDDTVSLPDLRDQIRKRFGLDLPLNSLRAVLTRAAKRGYLNRQFGVFTRNKDALAALPFEEVELRVLREHGELLRALISHSQSKFGLSLTPEEAEQALAEYLREYDLAVLYAAAEGASVAIVGKSAKNAKYIVSSFVQHVQAHDPTTFGYLETVIKGQMLANALFLPDPGKVARHFERTSIYLDTRFLLFAVGYAGEARKAPCAELVTLLYGSGAELRCLTNTLEEARRILDACSWRLRTKDLRAAHGETLEHFIEAGCTSSDVELMSVRLPAALSAMHVEIAEKPSHDRKYQVDETGLEKALQEALHYLNPKALVHDVDAVSAIARLRQGRESFAVETCKALFVTTNPLLARATRQFFQAEATPGAVALCLTDYSLATLLWLKNPTKAPDLPRRQLIAEAYAAMQPPEGLWRKYLTEIARLEEKGEVSSEDYLILRHSLAAKAALMDLTMGDEETFTEGTVKEVLQVALEKARAGVRADLAQEQTRREEAEREGGVFRAKEEARRTKVKSSAGRWAKGISRAIFGLAFAALVMGSLYTFPWSLPKFQSAWLRYLTAITSGGVFFLSLSSLLFGTTIQALVRNVEVSLARRIESALSSWLGV